MNASMDESTMKCLLDEIRGLRTEMNRHNESLLRAIDMLETRVRKLENWRAGVVTMAAVGAFIATVFARIIGG